VSEPSRTLATLLTIVMVLGSCALHGPMGPVSIRHVPGCHGSHPMAPFPSPLGSVCCADSHQIAYPVSGFASAILSALAGNVEAVTTVPISHTDLHSLRVRIRESPPGLPPLRI